MLDWMVALDYGGTELGPPGFMGDGARMGERLAIRGLEFIGHVPAPGPHRRRALRARPRVARRAADGSATGPARRCRAVRRAVRRDRPAGPPAGGGTHRQPARRAARRCGLAAPVRQPPPLGGARRLARLPAGHPPALRHVPRDRRRDRPPRVGHGRVARWDCASTPGTSGSATQTRRRASAPTGTSSGTSTSRTAPCGSATRPWLATRTWSPRSPAACSARSELAMRTSRRRSPHWVRSATRAGWSSSRTSSSQRRSRVSDVVAGQRANREYLARLGL